MSLRSSLLTVLLASALMPPLGLAAPTTSDVHATLRTANYFLRAGFELDASLETLATYDLLILPAEAQVLNRESLEQLRQRNPSIVLLAYVPTVSWNDVWFDELHDELKTKLKEDDWLLDGTSLVSIWPGTTALDLTGAWNTTLATYVAHDIMGTGLWDGVMYDEVSDEIWWDSSRASLWHEAYAHLFAQTAKLAPDAMIVTNGSSSTRYAETTDGRLFESFPTPWEADGDWATQMRSMLTTHEINVVNVNTNNTGILSPANLRIGIAAALMANAYLSLDYGTTSHGQLWSIPDFDGDIGTPQGDTIELPNGLWIRHFSEGTVIANPTDSVLGWEDGKIEVTLSANDAIIISE